MLKYSPFISWKPGVWITSDRAPTIPQVIRGALRLVKIIILSFLVLRAGSGQSAVPRYREYYGVAENSVCCYPIVCRFSEPGIQSVNFDIVHWAFVLKSIVVAKCMNIRQPFCGKGLCGLEYGQLPAANWITGFCYSSPFHPGLSPSNRNPDK